MMGFVMPSKMSMETVPKPTGDNVSVSEMPSAVYAAITFSGHAMDDDMLQKKQELLNLLEEDGKYVPTVSGDHVVWMMARYDPPWTPDLQRTNEVLVQVSSATTATA